VHVLNVLLLLLLLLLLLQLAAMGDGCAAISYAPLVPTYLCHMHFAF
jgi:hypothetical protein